MVTLNLGISVVSASPTEAREVLDSSIASLPQMSTGQVQMLILPQAILKLRVLQSLAYIHRQNTIMPILLQDEAASSLDLETEAVMHSVIHEEFTGKGHTVISITHRLSGVTEGQGMVVQLSKGRVERIIGAENIL